MDLAAGAMGNLTPKLLQLLQGEYKLHKDVKAQIQTLAKELVCTHVALCKVAQVPYDELDPQVKLWASVVREASYDMEDVLDTLLVRHRSTGDADKGKVHRLVEKMGKMFRLSRFKPHREIAGAIVGIKQQVNEMTARRDRYKVDDVVANYASTTRADPHVFMTLRTKALKLVDIDGPKEELTEMLTRGDDKKTKIVSVVGWAGVGKTSLAKVVYQKLTMDLKIYCRAFVTVGNTRDFKKVFRDILLDLDKPYYMNKTNSMMILNEMQLIEEIKAFLKEKRYFIVIDDIWDASSWDAISTAFQDNNLGSKIMITTRRMDIAMLAHCTCTIQSLRPDSSKRLFYKRIFEPQDRCPEFFSEFSDKFVRICHGVPLFIITIAGLFANKKYDITEWQNVYDSMGSGLGHTILDEAIKILLPCYYDLPSSMKSCFLYLSMYPYNYEISRDGLIWRWICEGFIQPQKEGDDLFELGKYYFNDLINRSLVEPTVEMDGEIYSCRVHGVILDLIRSLSREVNFVTESSDIEQVTSPESKKVRRFSLESTSIWPKEGITQVRSVAVFQPSIDSMPSFSCLDMLRVLDLEGCFLKIYGGSKLYVGNLIHLRYLGLRGTGLEVFPGGIEKLQFLKVLRLDSFIESPGSIFGLRGLMCLEGVHCCPRPGNLLSNLVSLQVLDTLYLDEDCVGAVEALGRLTQLTVLEIFIKFEMVDRSFCDALSNSLGNLTRLQFMRIMCNSFIGREHWAPPPFLGISPASLPRLTYVDIMMHTAGAEDIKILGRLPNLVAFQLEADYQNYLEQPLQRFVVSAGAFPCLKRCFFRYVAIVPSMFTRGAIPRVEHIRFCLRAWDFFSDTGLDFDDLAMDHLPSLQTVSCVIHGETDVTGEEEVKELREAVKRASDVHPNHPELSILKEIGRA